MKYLICEDFSGQPICFVFPRRVDHLDMREQLPYRKFISAGFVELDKGAFTCFAGSQEMGLVARPEEDAALIAEALRVRPRP